MIAWRREESAFDRLAGAYLRPLYRVALRLTGQKVEAEDLVQETLLKAFRHRDQLRDPDKVRAWLFTILRSCHLDELRKKGKEPDVPALTEAGVNGICSDRIYRFQCPLSRIVRGGLRIDFSYERARSHQKGLYRV